VPLDADRWGIAGITGIIYQLYYFRVTIDHPLL
jgi:hypothetical protein